MKNYAIQKSFYMDKKNNEKYRVTVMCRVSKSCLWRIYGSLLMDGHSFIIKSIKRVHNYCEVVKNLKVTSSWIANKSF